MDPIRLPPKPPDVPLPVDPQLAAKRAMQEQHKRQMKEIRDEMNKKHDTGLFSGASSIPVVLSPLVDAIKSAFNSTVDQGYDAQVREFSEKKVATEALTAAGFVKKLGLVGGALPGTVLGKLLEAPSANTNNESLVADQFARDRAVAATRLLLGLVGGIVWMPRMWDSDP